MSPIIDGGGGCGRSSVVSRRKNSLVKLAVTRAVGNDPYVSPERSWCTSQSNLLALATRFIGPGAKISGVAVVCAHTLRSRYSPRRPRPHRRRSRPPADGTQPGLGSADGALLNAQSTVDRPSRLAMELHECVCRERAGVWT